MARLHLTSPKNWKIKFSEKNFAKYLDRSRCTCPASISSSQWGTWKNLTRLFTSLLLFFLQLRCSSSYLSCLTITSSFYRFPCSAYLGLSSLGFCGWASLIQGMSGSQTRFHLSSSTSTLILATSAHPVRSSDLKTRDTATSVTGASRDSTITASGQTNASEWATMDPSFSSSW